MIKTTLVLLFDSPARNKILMIFKKRGQGKGLWNFPGGKVEKGETVLSAATRECQEETGLLTVNQGQWLSWNLYFLKNRGTYIVIMALFTLLNLTGVY